MIDSVKFLSEFVPIFSKYDAIIKSKRENSEYYNIFSVLNLETKEEKLHSKLIADLLNPYSMHGCGDLFLKKFFKKLKDISNLCGNKDLDFDDIIDDVESVKVEIEKYIGAIDKDYTNGGYIDIYIELLLSDKSKVQVVIENKIDAGEQPNQVSRYYKYLYSENNKSENAEEKYILYLTKNGEEPSVYSTGNSDKIKSKTYLISYKDFILPWTEECIKLVSERPKIREILVQYRDILLRFWGFAEVREMSDEFISKLLEGDTLKHIAILANYIGSAKAKIIEKLKNEIATKLVGTEIEFICNLTEKKHTGFIFKKGLYGCVFAFNKNGFISLFFAVYMTDKKLNDWRKEEVKIVADKFPELQSVYSYYDCPLWGFVSDIINNNNLNSWSIDLFCDMNKNTRQYADYFINKAINAFDRLEK